MQPSEIESAAAHPAVKTLWNATGHTGEPFANDQTPTIVGIDPGNTGAVAYIYEDGTADVEDCPIAGKEIDHHNAAELLKHRRITHAFIEQVSAMPGQGVSGMFKFGGNFGAWKGILAALDIKFTLVSPQRWKGAMGVVGKLKDPDAGRQRALQLFPGLAMHLKRKKDGGRADALLIAEYGRRITKGL